MQVKLNACSSTDRCPTAPARPPSITTLNGSYLECQLQIPRCLVRLNSSSRLTLSISNPNLNLESASYFATMHPSLMLPNMSILPILDFGDVIYKIASNTLLSKLDAVHHSAIRFVTKAPYTTHHCDLYALVVWPSLHICHQTH